MKFLPLTIEHKQLIKDYQSGYTEISLSLADYVTTFLWNASGKVSFCIENDILYIKNIYANKHVIMLPPFAKDKGKINFGLEQIFSYFLQNNLPVHVRGITNFHLARISSQVKESFDVKYDRAGCEYIYRVEDLINLTLHKSLRDKASKISRFEAMYNPVFRECTVDDYNEIIALSTRWNKAQAMPAVSEFRAICRMLDNRKELNIKCGVLLINNKIVGFSAGSIMYNGHAQILFEKGETSYNGIYQALNRYMLQTFFSGCKYVNREEDLGIEGLRRSKLSYCPSFIQDVYYIKDKDSSVPQIVTEKDI